MAKIYCITTNTGKGFITHADREACEIQKVPYANIWVIDDNPTGQAWITRVGGVIKTEEEAQTILDAQTATLQSEWDSLPEDDPNKIDRPNTTTTRPLPIVLPSIKPTH